MFNVIKQMKLVTYWCLGLFCQNHTVSEDKTILSVPLNEAQTRPVHASQKSAVTPQGCF